jgi:hypothetical protein
MSIFYNEIGSALPQNAALQHSEACRLALRDLLQLVERACSALNDYIADLIGLSRCLDRGISIRDYCIGLIVDVLLQLISDLLLCIFPCLLLCHFNITCFIQLFIKQKDSSRLRFEIRIHELQ